MSEPTTPFVFDTALAVCVDFRNPHAWLAIEPSCALAAKLGIRIDWLPRLVPPPQLGRPAAESEERGVRHRSVRADYFARDLARYAAARGSIVDFAHCEGDGLAPALGLLHARALVPARTQDYVTAMFEAIWSDARGAGRDTVASLLTELGVDARGFEARVSELHALDASLAAAGVHGVPCYVVDDEPYVGRAHLPMIEWQLTGRAGPPPI